LETQASVAKGTTSIYVANVIVLVANTLYFLILTNVLHSTLSVGILVALNLAITFLVTICILAQPVTSQSPIPAPLAVLKFVPELIARGAHSKADRIFRTTLITSAILAIAIAILLSLLPTQVISLIGGPAVLPEFVRLVAVDVVFYSFCQVCFGEMIALSNFKDATVYMISWSVVRYALSSILLIPYAIVGVLLGWIAGDAIVAAIALRKLIHVARRDSGSTSFAAKELWRYSLYTLLSALIGYAVTQADKLFTLASQGLSQLAVYNVAIVASSFPGFAPYALLTVLLPALSALHSTRKSGEMRELVRNYTRYVSIVVLPIAFGFASVAEVALRIFGPEYVGGLLPTVIVSVATGLTGIGSVYASVLLATGELKWYTASNILGLGALILVSALTTSPLGIIGPALGRAALLAVATFVYAVAAQKIGFFELDVQAYLTATASSSVMGIVVYAAFSTLTSFLARLAFLPLLVLGGAAVYLVCLRLLRLINLSDVEFAIGIMPDRFHPVMLRIVKLLTARNRQ
jgi:O-antigen/teichoic acid export membrane protein